MSGVRVLVDATELDRRLGSHPELARRVVKAWLPEAGLITRQVMIDYTKLKFKRPRGALNASIRSSVSTDGKSVTTRPTVPYRVWVNEGTGIYGPRRAPIVPKKAKALSWIGGGGRVFARSTRGMPGIRYAEHTAQHVERPVAEALERVLAREVENA